MSGHTPEHPNQLYQTIVRPLGENRVSRIYCNFFPLAQTELSYVLAGIDLSLDEPTIPQKAVAIKVLRDPERIDVLDRHELLQGLNDPSLVRVIDVFRNSTESLCIEMPLIQGKTFASLVKKREVTQERLMQFFHTLILVSDYLDRQDCVHTDLKADNVMVTPNNDMIVIDPDSIIQKGTAPSIRTQAYPPPETLRDPSSWNQYAMQYVISRIVLDVAVHMNNSAFQEGGSAYPVLLRASSDLPEERYSNLQTFYDTLKESLAYGR